MRRMLVLTAVAAVAVACGGGDATDDDATGGDGGSDGATGGQVLTIADFAFGDVPTIAPGDELTVENTDDAPHTVTADDGSFDLDVDGGGTATLTVDAAGEYALACTIHPSMTATLTVEG